MTALEAHIINIKSTLGLVADGLWKASEALDTVIYDAEMFLIRPDRLYKNVEMEAFQRKLFNAKAKLLQL
jgi:hypothetical protein